MGFGKKTDFETGRTLDLNLTYNYIIKPAVTAAGLKCIRADEITHSGPIDVPMYEQLLDADVVIADLSTSNKNAFYELGVRHALKPFTTIVICEDGLKTFPFDVNHVAIRQYHHLGDGIDYGEVERFRKSLTEAIVEIQGQDPRHLDSPVYTFLSNLAPPKLAEALHAVAQSAVSAAPSSAAENRAAEAEPAQRYSELLSDIDEAQQAGNFDEAKSLLNVLRRKMTTGSDQGAVPEDPYIIQRLALVTYKAKQESKEKEIAALNEARDLLALLNPRTSNDTETLGLWGAVHKQLWNKTGDPAALNAAIRSAERGYYLRNDYYNGINYAFLLNVRAAAALVASRASGATNVAETRAAAIADVVNARRVRQEVVQLCDQWLASHPAPPDTATTAAKEEHLKTKYWVAATKAEALLGSDSLAEADTTYNGAYSFAPATWMIDSTKDQRKKLEQLIGDSPMRYVSAQIA